MDPVILKTETPNPTLEETAAKMGIDPATVDSTETTQTAPERPSWLPEGINTPEDLRAAYEALKAKEPKEANEADPAERTEQEQSTTEEETQENAEDETKVEPSEAEKAATEAAEKSGLNLSDLSNSYWEQGHLTDEQYASLEKGGYPKNLVDQFIAGQTAMLNAARTEAFTEVGGEEAYNTMLEWAASGKLTKGEVDAYNKAVNSQDTDARMGAIRGLKARHQADVGFEPSRQVEGRGRAAATDNYESVAQMMADMNNPKYKSDPAFRAKVEQKIERSDIF